MMKRTTRLLSSSSTIDSGIFVSPSLDDVICSPGVHRREEIIIENCPWSTETADLILKVEESLFPVKRMVLWEYSGFFRGIFSNTIVMDDDDFKILTLNGIYAYDMEEILPYFYDPFKEIPELEVLEILEMAYLLDCPKLTKKCEAALLEATDVHPIDLLKLASKYNLEVLKAMTISAAAMMPKIASYQDFVTLDLEIQKEIRKRLANNCRFDLMAIFGEEAAELKMKMQQTHEI